MEELESIEEVTERIEAIAGAENITHLDVTDEPDTLVVGPLGELADSEQGGVLMVLGVGVDDDGCCALDRLAALFPIIQTNTSEVDEGWLWIAVVAGTNGVPKTCGDANTVLRMAELAPIVDAGLEELDLSPLGVKRRLDRIEPDEVLEAVLSDEECIWDKGIATIRGGRVVCTVVGMVGLGRHPYRHLPGLCVELNLYGEKFCWRGTSRELVARAGDVTWPCLLPGKNKFRELFVNALVHRGWRRCDWRRSIQVTVSDGTLEITNPGLLGEGRPGKSVAVNPKLFALFCELGMANAKGVGLDMVDRYLIKKQFRQFELRTQEGMVQFEMPWPYRPESQATPPEPARRHAEPAQAASPSSYRPSGGSGVRSSGNAQEGRQLERPVERTSRSYEAAVERFDDRDARAGGRSTDRGQAGQYSASGDARAPEGQIGPKQITFHPAGLYRDSRFPEGQIGPKQITFNPTGLHRETSAPVRPAEPPPSRNVAPARSGSESRAMDHQAKSSERHQDPWIDGAMDRLQRVAGPNHEIVRSQPRQPARREPELRSASVSPVRVPSHFPGTATSSQARPFEQPGAETAPSVARTPLAAQTPSRVPPEHSSGLQGERARRYEEAEGDRAPIVAPAERVDVTSSGRSVPEPPPPMGMAAFYARWLTITHQPAGHRVPEKWTIAEMIKFESLREIIAQLAPGDPEHRNRVFGELLKRWKNCEVTVTGSGEFCGSWMLVDDGPRTKTGVPYKLVRV